MTMRRLFLSLIFVLLVCPGCDRGTSEVAVDDAAVNAQAPREERVPADGVDQARQLIARGSFDAARGVLERYLQTHPDDPVALEMAGDGSVQAQNSDQSFE